MLGALRLTDGALFRTLGAGALTLGALRPTDGALMLGALRLTDGALTLGALRGTLGDGALCRTLGAGALTLGALRGTLGDGALCRTLGAGALTLGALRGTLGDGAGFMLGTLGRLITDGLAALGVVCAGREGGVG